MDAQLNGDTDLRSQYRQALRSFIANQQEMDLHRGYEIGRHALSSSAGIFDVVNIHHDALLSVIRENHSAEPAKLIEAGMRFLLECLSPFEMMHMGNRETNAALRRLNDMLEAQARRIAHDLHDEFAQLLATVYLDLAEISRNAKSEPIPSIVDRTTSHLDQVREQLRRLSHELRPPILDQLGLLPALEFLANGFRKRSGLAVSVTGSTDGRLQNAIEISLYRIVQEALNNVTRHAQASNVEIKVWRDRGMLRCTVQDDGIGFSDAPVRQQKTSNGLGLIGIQERLRPLYGAMTIDSKPGKGTELRVAIPLK